MFKTVFFRKKCFCLINLLQRSRSGNINLVLIYSLDKQDHLRMNKAPVFKHLSQINRPCRSIYISVQQIKKIYDNDSSPFPIPPFRSQQFIAGRQIIYINGSLTSINQKILMPILKNVCQSVTFPLWACREKFNIDFLSQNFFLASPHVY